MKKLMTVLYQTKMHWLTVCCLFFAITIIQGQCPIPCNCYLTDSNCTSRGLKVVPNGTFENNTQVLLLNENKLTSLPPGIFDNLKNLKELYLNDNQLKSLPKGIFDKNVQLKQLYLKENQLASFPDGIFDKNVLLDTLNFKFNLFTSMPDGIFDKNQNLKTLAFSANKLASLPAGIFAKNKQLTEIIVPVNLLTHFPAGLFDNNKNLNLLQLSYNRISFLHRDIFKYQINLKVVYMQGNKIENIPQGLFRNCLKLFIVSLQNNLIKKIPEDLLKGATSLYALALGKNKIQHLPDGFLNDSKSLGLLALEVNELRSIDVKRFRKLDYLMFHQNRITSRSLSRTAIHGLTQLEILGASYNHLEHVSDYTFLSSSYLKHILLNNNRLKRITNRTLYGASQLQMIFLSDNPIEYIASRAFFFNSKLTRLYLLQTKIKSVDIQWYNPSIYSIGTAMQIYPSDSSHTLKTTVTHINLEQVFTTLGFNCTMKKRRPYLGYCTPCLSGSYVTTTTGAFCTDCPAGGFYEDSVAFFGERGYGNGCKMCDNGTFVHVKDAPGRRQQDCKPCPEGTENKVFASFKACPCQDGFYRLDRFEKCYSCPSTGVTCFNESMTLKSGYYWQWISLSEKENYINFTNNLQIFDDSYNRDLVTFIGSFPKHYQCPRSMSCLGGLDANCAEGYTGPLCAVCDKKHYILVSTCFKCPKLGWLIFQITAISLIVVAVLFMVIRLRHRRTRGNRSLTDIILARLKIIVSFYQVFSSTLDGFSYVQWPSALTKLSEYAKFVQLNVFQIAPLHCFTSRLKMDAYDHLVSVCSVTTAVILMALVYYNLKRLYLHKTAKRSRGTAILHDLENTKEACYRNVFLFLFVTYPQTCSTIIQMLPAACHRICQDSRETQCTFYLKADYSITCFTDKYNRYVILAYAALIYPFAVPLLAAAVLWKYHYKPLQKKAGKECGGKMIRERSKASRGQPTNESQCFSKSYGPDKDIHPEQIGATPTEHRFGTEKRSLSKNNSQTDGVILISVSKEDLPEDGREERIGEETAGKKEKRRTYSESAAAVSIPIVAGMSFIYENYTDNCWFWETIEMMRKLLLTSSLALIGAEGRTSLGVASILSGCYAILHAHFKPIPDKFEHVLQLTSLLATFSNTCIGMMLKIDQGALLDADAKIMDSWIMTALLVMANVMVTAIVTVKYLVVFGRAVYSIIKNPRCSLACCLSVILTLDEVQSEARSMESSSGWEMKTLQCGSEFEGLSMEDAAVDYGLTGIHMEDDNDNVCDNRKQQSQRTK